MKLNYTTDLKGVKQLDLPVWLVPFFFDFSSRFGIFILLKQNRINGLAFWLLQVLVVTIISFILTFVNEERVNKKLKPYGYKISYGLEFIAIITIIAMVSYGSFNIYKHWWTWVRVILALIVFIIYGFYSIIIYVSSPALSRKLYKQHLSKIKSEDQKFNNKENSDMKSSVISHEVYGSFDISKADENDILIVELENKVSSMNNKVDAYILESGLFGALAFAGFIQFTSSSSVKLEEVSEVLNCIKSISIGIISIDIQRIIRCFAKLTNTQYLILLLILESLISTLSFVSVIASRLRFSDVLEAVELETRLARSFNDKEEDVINIALTNNDEKIDKIIRQRMEYLNSKIQQNLQLAYNMLEKLTPILQYMRFFRNFGIINFLFVIITGAFIVNSNLGRIFILVSFIAFVYTYIDQLLRNRHIRNLACNSREFLTKR